MIKKLTTAVICAALIICAYGCNAEQKETVSEQESNSASEISEEESECNSSDILESSEDTETGSAENGEDTDISAEQESDSQEVSEESTPSEEESDPSEEESTPDAEESLPAEESVVPEPDESSEDEVSGETDNTDKACTHENTKLVNVLIATTQTEGYTGDTCCKDCGEIIATGTVIEKRPSNTVTTNKVTYTLPDGSKVTLDKNENLRDYLLHLYTKYISHENSNIEEEIFRLVNIEREKAGVSPLEWNEDGYFFTEIRAEECGALFSHTRPNGCGCETVYSDHNILLYGYWAENLGRLSDNASFTDTEIAKMLVDAWMNSASHRNNILNSAFTSVSIAYVHMNGYHIVVQNFFG